MWHTQPLNLQFSDDQESVVGGAVRGSAVAEINHLGACVFRLAAGVTPFDRNAIADEVVELAVVLDERACEVHPCQFFDGLLAGGFWQVGIEALQRNAEIADQNDLSLTGAP